jgi:hypothetical protein
MPAASAVTGSTGDVSGRMRSGRRVESRRAAPARRIATVAAITRNLATEVVVGISAQVVFVGAIR